MKSIKEVAQELNISTRTVYRLVESGKIAAINVGTGVRRSLRVTPDTLNYFLEQNNPEYGWKPRRRRNAA